MLPGGGVAAAGGCCLGRLLQLRGVDGEELELHVEGGVAGDEPGEAPGAVRQVAGDGTPRLLPHAQLRRKRYTPARQLRLRRS
eukprot:1194155-Prorocentrum_minimum.AAC.5